MEPETLVIGDDGCVAVAAKRGGRGGEEVWLLITGAQAGTAFRTIRQEGHLGLQSLLRHSQHLLRKPLVRLRSGLRA
ncbi:MAG: hypothetical protein WCB12_12830 [Bryobacteraceae bacterium]